MNPALLILSESNFDVLLRRSPVAMIAFVSPTTDTHYPTLQPAIDDLAAAYDRTGVLIGHVTSKNNRDLLDRACSLSSSRIQWRHGEFN